MLSIIVTNLILGVRSVDFSLQVLFMKGLFIRRTFFSKLSPYHQRGLPFPDVTVRPLHSDDVEIICALTSRKCSRFLFGKHLLHVGFQMLWDTVFESEFQGLL